MRWVTHAAHIGEMRNAHNILVGKPDGSRPLWRPRCKWENDIKLDIKETGYDGVD
jgi:hypothetical protein